jgi:hypothetical protein
MTIALAVVGLGLFAVLVAVAARRQTRYVHMVMSDAWLRAHAGDPFPDHLR